MVIGDLDIEGVAIDPPKADPPLIVYADAELVCPITLQCFKSVPGWNPQISQIYGVCKKSQPATRHGMKGGREILDEVPEPDAFGHSVLETFDHVVY